MTKDYAQVERDAYNAAVEMFATMVEQLKKLMTTHWQRSKNFTLS